MKKDINNKSDNQEDSSKWLELANLISRENRKISIIEEIKDPVLKKIHDQRVKFFSDGI